MPFSYHVEPRLTIVARSQRHPSQHSPGPWYLQRGARDKIRIFCIICVQQGRLDKPQLPKILRDYMRGLVLKQSAGFLLRVQHNFKAFDAHVILEEISSSRRHTGQGDVIGDFTRHVNLPKIACAELLPVIMFSELFSAIATGNDIILEKFISLQDLLLQCHRFNHFSGYVPNIVAQENQYV